MKNTTRCLASLVLFASACLQAQNQTDHSEHEVQFVTVDPRVELEEWLPCGSSMKKEVRCMRVRAACAVMVLLVLSCCGTSVGQDGIFPRWQAAPLDSLRRAAE